MIGTSFDGYSTVVSRLARLGVQLIDCAALLDFPDETHVDATFGSGGRGVRNPRELFYDGTTRKRLPELRGLACEDIFA